VENHGVDPDIEVDNTPAEVLAGRDHQLDTAVDLMLRALALRTGSR
jgi:tricorn protease